MSNRTGFEIEMGFFGSGKTQNATKHLKNTNPLREVNISNYYTGYTNFQLSNHQDIVDVCSDIYNYHQFFNLLKDIKKLYTHKKKMLPSYLYGLSSFLYQYLPEKNYKLIVELFNKGFETGIYDNPFLYNEAWNQLDSLVNSLDKAGYFREFPYFIKFNIVLDESSLYFNPRDFEKNFKGPNSKLLEFVYQPRKLNMLFVPIVQNPNELDVKFRRLAQTFRMYYKGLHFIRWHKDFFFPNPEDMNFETAEVVGWGINFNFFPLFPRYDYNTKELIRVGESIYSRGSLFPYLNILLERRRKLKGYKKLFYTINSFFNGMSTSSLFLAFCVFYFLNLLLKTYLGFGFDFGF